jgi:hypothetical protein
MGPDRVSDGPWRLRRGQEMHERGGMHCSWCQGDIGRPVLYEADQAWLFGRVA